ncbi:LuxR C-terminal-related transcriptional regulator [Roseiflexus castenholzii]|jgi:DNA-binding NarL/FixJ family response regulator|uniref:Two component transcriptional regulator, LuxR family n=1 Tax=Roseiflexus castenholzii (strain DSM 13941 / HLO8) TaxID=383372 RepID=A7NFW3_ROSCS|nr:response regulator transcription factor [Roseiflexus castenholzii]ABU56344.1 two component transcriptional regulator, LuxR family [Roseiflexus castenholzii DSM 13941]
MASRRARIVLADQQHLFRQGLAQLLRNAGHVVVGEADTLESLDRCMIDTEPEIVMLDRYLPGGDVFEYVHMLHTLQPQTSVLLLVAYEHEVQELQGQAFLTGASGCLSKELQSPAYLQAVRRMQDGQLLFPAEVLRRAARPQTISGPIASLSELTSRELEILQLIAEGLGNREIAARLDISYNTAMKHVSNILAKLKVSNRMEAGLLFLRHTADGTLPGVARQTRLR